MSIKPQADAVVIGSGAFGASTAFWLAERGLDVVLLDKFDLVSQTSPRAAGLSQQVQVDDTLAGLAIRGIEMLRGFRELTGEDLDVVVNGSVKVARHEDDAIQLREEVRRGQALGVDIHEVSREEADCAVPWLSTDSAVAVSLAFGDTYIEHPGDLPRAFVRALQRRGGTALGHAEVTGVLVDEARVTGVRTPHGTIETPVVVDAAGAWTRIVGQYVDFNIPLWPARHQVCITEPLAEVNPNDPTVRIMDARVYVRPAAGGLMFGAYEPDPLLVDPRERPAGFQIADLEFQLEPLRAKINDVRSELPIFDGARIAELRGGLPTMTPDGHFLVDRLEAVQGFFVASGCNVGGLSISPALGEVLADWIVSGSPRPAVLDPHRLDRFTAGFEDDDALRKACELTYSHKYGRDEVTAPG
jgi:glycine/D-amino acid oxidase-like deaminating enzyme